MLAVQIQRVDCTNYHTDKSFLQTMTTRYLNQLGMRCIMMGTNLRIVAPYRGNAAKRQWMTDWLRNRFKSIFGRDFPCCSSFRPLDVYVGCSHTTNNQTLHLV
jgi:hypothetical protein